MGVGAALAAPAQPASRLLTLAATVAVSAWWSFVLLARATDFHPWLRVGRAGRRRPRRPSAAGHAGGCRRRIGRPVAAGRRAGARVLAGPAAYAVQTAADAAHRLDPSRPVRPSQAPASAAAAAAASAARGGAACAAVPGRRHGPGGGFPGGGTTGTGGGPGGGCRGGGGGGGMGGLLNAATAERRAEVALLRADAAAVHLGRPPRSAPTRLGLPAGHRRLPVMADRRLQRQRPVADAGAVPAVRRRREDPLLHRRRRLGGGAAATAAAASAPQIAAWVAANFTAQTVGGVTVYDLTAPAPPRRPAASTRAGGPVLTGGRQQASPATVPRTPADPTLVT